MEVWMRQQSSERGPYSACGQVALSCSHCKWQQPFQRIHGVSNSQCELPTCEFELPFDKLSEATSHELGTNLVGKDYSCSSAAASTITGILRRLMGIILRWLEIFRWCTWRATFVRIWWGHYLQHNSWKRFTTNQIFTKESKIVVRASVPIMKGPRITISFLSSSLLFSGRMQRLKSLEKTKFGSCQCQRCSDPTELGTFINGIFCLLCRNREGILL